MKYAITSAQLDGCITLEYEAEGGMLVSASFDFAMRADQAAWLSKHFPTNERFIESLKTSISGTVHKYESLPTFADFYNKYGNKVGKKEAETAWKKLTDAERVQALRHIVKYKQSIKGWQDMLMPASYLNKKRFLDFEK
jgi:hypothetical protein